MGGRRRDRVVGGIVAAICGGLLLLATADRAQAQPSAASAEVKRLTGQVEVLKKGETQWAPLMVGAKLVEGDDIRAYAGANAELALPDGSTLFVAENSRLVVSKLEFDSQDRTRVAAFYLAAGKVRALVSKAAISLIRSRQSNFVISTPTAVAAARGTHYEVTYDASQRQTRVAVLPEPARAPESAKGEHESVFAASNIAVADRF